MDGVRQEINEGLSWIEVDGSRYYWWPVTESQIESGWQKIKASLDEEDNKTNMG